MTVSPTALAHNSRTTPFSEAELKEQRIKANNGDLQLPGGIAFTMSGTAGNMIFIIAALMGTATPFGWAAGITISSIATALGIHHLKKPSKEYKKLLEMIKHNDFLEAQAQPNYEISLERL